MGVYKDVKRLQNAVSFLIEGGVSLNVKRIISLMLLSVFLLIPVSAYAASPLVDQFVNSLNDVKTYEVKAVSPDYDTSLYYQPASDEMNNNILFALKSYKGLLDLQQYNSSKNYHLIYAADAVLKLNTSQIEQIKNAFPADRIVQPSNSGSSGSDTGQTKSSLSITDMINNEPGSVIERTIGNMIGNVASAVLNLIQDLTKIKTLDQILFNSGTPDDKMPFTDKQLQAMNDWYSVISSVATALLIIPIVLAIFKAMYAGINPKARENVKESVERLFASGIIIAVTPIVFRLLLHINNLLVYYLGTLIKGSPDRVLGINGIMQNIHTGSAIFTALVIFMFVYLNVRIALMFFIRQFMLIVFYILTPIMVVLWTINKNINAAQIWLGELLTNIFTQFFYAVVFLIYMSFIGNTTSWVESIAWAMLIIPLAEALRNSLQGYFARLSGVNEESAVSSAARFLGLGAALHGAGTVISQIKPAGAAGVAGAAAKMFTNSTGAGFAGPSNSSTASNVGGTASSIGDTTNTASSDGIASSSGSTSGMDTAAGITAPAMFASRPTGGIVGQSTGFISGASGNGKLNRTAPEMMAGALNLGNKIGHYTTKVGNIGSLAGLAKGEGGVNELRGLSSRVGKVTAFTASSIATAVNTAKYAKQNNIGYMDALKEMTGAKGSVRAVGRALHLNATSAFSDNQRVQQLFNSYHSPATSLDGMRWK